jgi:hypothetical protein
MVGLLKSLVTLGISYAGAEFLYQKARVQRSIFRTVVALVLTMIGLTLGGIGVIILLSGLFFYLADLPRFITPALITGGISCLIALLLIVESWRRVHW